MQILLLVFVLIVAANAAPILVRYVIGNRLRFPVDFNKKFIDSRRIFGSTKTWAGLISIVIVSITLSWLLGLDLEVGGLVAVGVMSGDLISSFVKRRLGLPESSMAIGLDQIPESLFPYMLVMEQLQFSWVQISIAVASFVVFELLVSRILFLIKIRNRPY